MQTHLHQLQGRSWSSFNYNVVGTTPTLWCQINQSAMLQGAIAVMDKLRLESLKVDGFNPDRKSVGRVEAAAAVELQRTSGRDAGNCLHTVCLPMYLLQLAPWYNHTHTHTQKQTHMVDTTPSQFENDNEYSHTCTRKHCRHHPVVCLLLLPSTSSSSSSISSIINPHTHTTTSLCLYPISGTDNEATLLLFNLPFFLRFAVLLSSLSIHL